MTAAGRSLGAGARAISRTAAPPPSLDEAEPTQSRDPFPTVMSNPTHALVPTAPVRSTSCSLLLAAAIALAAAPGVAQGRTWIVDGSNGAGTNFTDLPPAVNAAANGDQILVRAGSYTPASTGKALTILGQPGASFGNGMFEVTGLPAGRDFVLAGFFTSSIVKPQVRVRDCAGRVLLDRVRLQPFSGQITFGPAVQVENCALVTIAQCEATAHPALRASNSTVHVVATDLTGGDAQLTFTLSPSFPAADVVGGRLELTSCRLQGGDGFVGSQVAPPSPGLITSGTAVRLARTTFGLVAAGTGTVFSAPAVRGTGGSLRVDPGVTLTPYRGANAIEGTITVQTAALAAIQVLGAPPGGTVFGELAAQPGDLAAVFTGPPGDLLPLPGLGGELGISPAVLLHVFTAAVGTTGKINWTVPVPSDPSLRGSIWVWQSLSGHPTRGFAISNRACYTQN